GAIVRPVLRDTHRPEGAGGWEQVDELGAMAEGEREAKFAADGRGVPGGGFLMPANGEGGRGAPPELQHGSIGTLKHHQRVAPPTLPSPSGTSTEKLTPLVSPLHASLEALFPEKGETSPPLGEHREEIGVAPPLVAPPAPPLASSPSLVRDVERPLALVRSESLGAITGGKREHGAHLPPAPSIPSLSSLSSNGGEQHTQRTTRTPALVTPALPAVAATAARPAVPVAPHRPALRQLDPPEPVDVACEHDVPHLLRWGGRGVRVGRAVGPERLTGDWWDDGYARDYWRCEDATGHGDLLIYRERPSGGEDRWFIHGWYD
ncbi:MAG: hypothetical protein ABIT38_19010, partial [Gemmatimonadaceae bacterium]